MVVPVTAARKTAGWKVFAVSCSISSAARIAPVLARPAN
jgi:hypothetical protein